MLDLTDECWLARFTPNELQEIKSYKPIKLEPLPSEVHEYLNSYKGLVWTIYELHSVRKLLHELKWLIYKYIHIFYLVWSWQYNRKSYGSTLLSSEETGRDILGPQVCHWGTWLVSIQFVIHRWKNNRSWCGTMRVSLHWKMPRWINF